FALTGPQGPQSMQHTLDILATQPELSSINAQFGHYEAEEPSVVSRRIKSWSPLSFQDVKR
ncbi:MAG: hypothetical protein NTZ72_19770, partial [Afipia sp.]|nr:hypothetical protein [Afipia sp.]